MQLFILRGDIVDFDYQLLGVYTSKDVLLKGATNVIYDEREIATQAMQDYDFAGLVWYQIDTSNPNIDTTTTIPLNQTLDYDPTAGNVYYDVNTDRVWLSE